MKSERGQISVLLAAMVITFMLFFAFVVNTGMLVHAKINIQNAADLAAYSGAATQARQLTYISYLNYEMRRQYKKFLLRYYVVGTAAYETNPQTPTNAPRLWRSSMTGTPFNVPAVCVAYRGADNPCKVPNLRAVGQISGNLITAGDAIVNTLQNQLRALDLARMNSCAQMGQFNSMLLNYWVFNTDPDLNSILQEIQASGGNTPAAIDMARNLRTVRGLAQGIGLVPREILIRKRIDTLSRFINAPPKVNFDAAQVGALKAPNLWAKNERTVNAFLSAFNTLGNHLFDEISMDELLPNELIKLSDIKTEFDAFSLDLAVGSCTASQNNAAAAANTNNIGQPCVPCLTPLSLQSSSIAPVVGVYKDPSIMTYYAVRVRAKAKLPFSPFGPIEMKAYAAAQPFGSRIGPVLNSDDFSYPNQPPLSMSRCFAGSCINKIPNLPIAQNDTKPNTNNGWNLQSTQYYMLRKYSQQMPGGAANVPASYGYRELNRAYQAGMVPNPWESGKYNIPNDLNADPFVKNFGDDGLMSFYAPLFDPSSPGANNPAQEIVDILNSIAPSNPTSAAAFPPAARAALVNGITNYVNGKLNQGTGEDGEGINIVRIPNPFFTRPDGANRPQMITGIPPDIFMNQPAQVKTSWNDVLNGAYKTLGRTGYSVKFVPFAILRGASGITTDGTNVLGNFMPPGSGVGDDTLEMQH